MLANEGRIGFLRIVKMAAEINASTASMGPNVINESIAPVNDF